MSDASATRSDRTIVGLSMEIDKHLAECRPHLIPREPRSPASQTG